MFFVSSKIEKNIKITSGRRSATEEAARLRQSTRTPFIGWGGNRECVCFCVCSVLLLLPYILDLLWVFSSFFLSSRWRSRCRFLIVSGLGRRKVKETGWYWRLFSLTCGSRFTWNAVIISPLFRCEAMEWRDKSHSQRERERERAAWMTYRSYSTADWASAGEMAANQPVAPHSPTVSLSLTKVVALLMMFRSRRTANDGHGHVYCYRL